MQTLEYPKSYIVWDLETTGFSPSENHILEIGALVVVNGEIKQSHKWVLNNGDIYLNPQAEAIHGITKEIIAAEGVPAEMAFREFLSVLGYDMPNITHNGVKFDIPFLCEQAMRTLGWTIGEYQDFRDKIEKNAIDTAVLVKGKKLGLARKWNESFMEYAKRVMDIRAFGVKYNVTLCCEEMGIDRSGVTLHRAGGDCFLTNEILKNLLNNSTVNNY